MSATGRTPNLRVSGDQYPTPPWAVERLMEAAVLPVYGPARWLEPCAGAGTIIQAANRVLNARGERVNWHAIEVEAKYEAGLQALANPVVIGDFLHVVPARYDVVLTNPPFALAEEFVRACLPIAGHVVMLLRVGWMERRGALFDEYPADVWVLPDRPSFGRNKHGKIGTDAAMYAWFHWHPSSEGRIRVLGRTPTEVRSEWRRHLDGVLPKRGGADERVDEERVGVGGGGADKEREAEGAEQAQGGAPPWPGGPEDFGGEDYPCE